MRAWKLPRPSATAGWCRDDRNRLILLRIPPQVDLDPPPSSDVEETDTAENNDRDTDPSTTTTTTTTAPRKPASLPSFPPEIIHMISNQLHPVDRVCLALTCKPLASAILSAPRLCPTTWSRFSDRRYDWLLPESYSLILRLAHGWVPKDQLRYCWKCHKILPRDETYFRRRLQCKKTPKWSVKLDIPKDQWVSMSRRQRYNFLVETWCHSQTDDSSCLYCDFCRDRSMETNLVHHPVQCPVCLEKELTYVWRPPRKPWFRKKMLKVLKLVWAPIELVGCYVLMFCVLSVRFVCDQARRCWRAIC